jgi:hypothetical protein
MGKEVFSILEEAFFCLFAEESKKGTKCLLPLLAGLDLLLADGGSFLALVARFLKPLSSSRRARRSALA